MAQQQASENTDIVAPSCDVLILVAIDAELTALQSVCSELGVAFERKQWSSLGEYFERDGIIETSRPIACKNAARFVLSALRNNLS